MPSGIATTSKPNSVISKSNGLHYPQTEHVNYNNLTVPTIPITNSNGLELGFTQPVQVKKPPFAFRILVRLKYFIINFGQFRIN